MGKRCPQRVRQAGNGTQRRRVGDRTERMTEGERAGRMGGERQTESEEPEGKSLRSGGPSGTFRTAKTPPQGPSWRPALPPSPGSAVTPLPPARCDPPAGGSRAPGHLLGHLSGTLGRSPASLWHRRPRTDPRRAALLLPGLLHVWVGPGPASAKAGACFVSKRNSFNRRSQNLGYEIRGQVKCKHVKKQRARGARRGEDRLPLQPQGGSSPPPGMLQ